MPYRNPAFISVPTYLWALQEFVALRVEAANLIKEGFGIPFCVSYLISSTVLYTTFW